MQAEELQFFEVLMLVCEQLGCPEGAARFALAAVHEVRPADAAPQLHVLVLSKARIRTVGLIRPETHGSRFVGLCGLL